MLMLHSARGGLSLVHPVGAPRGRGSHTAYEPRGSVHHIDPPPAVPIKTETPQGPRSSARAVSAGTRASFRRSEHESTTLAIEAFRLREHENDDRRDQPRAEPAFVR